MASHSDDPEQLRQEVKSARERELDAELRREEWDQLLRGIGYLTRTLVYLIGLAALYVWFEPKSLVDRPLGSLTLGEVGNNLIWGALTLGGSMMLIKGFFADADGGPDYVNWKAWGKAGLWVLAIAALAWFIYG